MAWLNVDLWTFEDTGSKGTAFLNSYLVDFAEYKKKVGEKKKTPENKMYCDNVGNDFTSEHCWEKTWYNGLFDTVNFRSNGSAYNENLILTTFLYHLLGIPFFPYNGYNNTLP